MMALGVKWELAIGYRTLGLRGEAPGRPLSQLTCQSAGCEEIWAGGRFLGNFGCVAGVGSQHGGAWHTLRSGPLS